MGKQDVFTVRVPSELKARIDALAQDMDRSRSWVVNKALDEWVRYNAWFIAEVRKGVAEADAGEFVSPEELEATFKRLTGGDALDKAG